jgi:Rap/ran-GAP
MYCRAGQQTEEEMYNNEEGGPAFNEFLDIIGQRVRLKGFNKYKAGLCNKSKLQSFARNRTSCRRSQLSAFPAISDPDCIMCTMHRHTALPLCDTVQKEARLVQGS